MDNQIQYVYFLRRLGVDAGRIIGGDLKEGFKEILTLEFDDCIKTPDGGNLADSEKLKQVKKKYNSISYAGHGDGLFNLYVGVDRHNKVKKIFVEVENEDYGSEYFNTGSQPKLAWIYASYEFNKYYCNDQFFLEKRKDSTIRIKALDMKISSNFILFCDRDHYDPDFAESKEKVDKLFEEEYYSKKNISTSPTGNVANDDSETNIMINQAFPVKNGSYPVYLHCYEKDISEYEGKDRFAKIVVENLEGCYLNKDENGAIIFQRKQTPSLYLEKFFKSKSKKLFADKIDLRDSLSLKEVEKFKNIEELTLCGLSGIKDWSPILKLKKLKKLHLESCLISSDTSYNFFINLYKLPNLEIFSVSGDSPWSLLHKPKENIPKNIYAKKLKEYEIIFSKDKRNKQKGKDYLGFHGYGNESDKDLLQYWSKDLLQIYDFPNFEKIKTLQKLRIYNYFDPKNFYGHLFPFFDVKWGFLDHTTGLINNYLKSSQTKEVYFYGVDLNDKQLYKVDIHKEKGRPTVKSYGNEIIRSIGKITWGTKVKVNGKKSDTILKKYYGNMSNKDIKFLLENISFDY